MRHLVYENTRQTTTFEKLLFVFDTHISHLSTELRSIVLFSQLLTTIV